MEDLEAFTQDVAKAKEASEMAVCCERILSLIQVSILDKPVKKCFCMIVTGKTLKPNNQVWKYTYGIR